jgi:hypothetical protein
MLKNPMEKKVFFIKGPLDSPKNERAKKNLANYIKWKP